MFPLNKAIILNYYNIKLENGAFSDLVWAATSIHLPEII